VLLGVHGDANLYTAENYGGEEHPCDHEEDSAANDVDAVVVEGEDGVVVINKEANPYEHDDVGCHGSMRQIALRD
jgi:hypothetical protein